MNEFTNRARERMAAVSEKTKQEVEANNRTNARAAEIAENAIQFLNSRAVAADISVHINEVTLARGNRQLVIAVMESKEESMLGLHPWHYKIADKVLDAKGMQDALMAWAAK